MKLTRKQITAAMAVLNLSDEEWDALAPSTQEKLFLASLNVAKNKRKTGEHLFVPCGDHPRCATCGADEDDAFVGGIVCSYQAP
jgi:hypothetical protein